MSSRGSKGRRVDYCLAKADWYKRQEPLLVCHDSILDFLAVTSAPDVELTEKLAVQAHMDVDGFDQMMVRARGFSCKFRKFVSGSFRFGINNHRRHHR
jgi:hypothetical protein